jgi:putative peptidoglycan lipid II flippase
MNKNLLKSTFLVSLMTVTSRITGFLRDLVTAYIFGAGPAFDAFQAAFRIPNFLRRLSAEGAFSQAFIPVLSEYSQKRSNDEVRAFINHIAGSMLLILSIFTVIAVLVTPWLVYIFVPGFIHDPSRFTLATALLRIIFPYILLISLASLCSGILNAYGDFAIPAFTPNLLNLALIGAAIFLAPYFNEPIKALAWGVFIGGMAQLLFQLPFLHKLHLLPKPQILWRDAGVKRVWHLMIPAIFGVSVAQISVLVDNIFASFLRTGSISWLYYADRLTSFPLGVFGVAIATVVLPHLARKHAANSPEAFTRALDWALKFVLMIAIPAMLGIMLLAGPILATLLQHGKFSAFDVIMARKSLLGFAVGVPAFMLVKVLASGFYSRQDIKTPVRIAIIAMLSNIVMDAILVYPLKHAGLALATSLTSYLNAGLLCYMICRCGYLKLNKAWTKFFIQLITANLAMALVLWFATADLSLWLQWSAMHRVIQLAVLCLGAVIIYLLTLFLAGIRWRDVQFIE